MRVTVADVAEWETYDMGAMGCECGAMTLTTEPDLKGWPVPIPVSTDGGA